jgi:hypothetical protein
MDTFRGPYEYDGEELRLQHLSLGEVADLSRLDFSDWYKFAFVRNPWDRLVSHFFFKNRKKESPDVKAFCAYIDRVEQIVSKREHLHGEHCHLRPQVEFLSDDLDFVGRFESFESDLMKVMDQIGISRARIPHSNKSTHGPYTEYFDDRTKKKVADIYAADIETLNYRFGTVMSK